MIVGFYVREDGRVVYERLDRYSMGQVDTDDRIVNEAKRHMIVHNSDCKDGQRWSQYLTVATHGRFISPNDYPIWAENMIEMFGDYIDLDMSLRKVFHEY